MFYELLVVKNYNLPANIQRFWPKSKKQRKVKPSTFLCFPPERRRRVGADGTFLSGFDRYWKKAGDLFCLSAFGFADYEKLKAYLAEKYNDDEKAWQKIVKEMKDNGLSPSVDESEGGPDYMTNMI